MKTLKDKIVEEIICNVNLNTLSPEQLIETVVEITLEMRGDGK